MSTISTNYLSYISDPTRSINAILTDLASDLGGNMEVVDASNAFVMLLEASTHLASQAVISNQLGLQRRYACLATTFGEIYPHLSSEDIPHIFTLPTRTTLTVAVLLDTFLSAAVLDVAEGCHKVTIPKRTEVTVDDLTFSFDRSVTIYLYNNKVIKVAYNDDGMDTSIYSDVAVINGISAITTIDAVPWIKFNVDVQQINYITYNFNVMPSISFRETVGYVDNFNSIEILYVQGGIQRKMDIALTDRVYDPLTPTAIIIPDDTNHEVSIFIPPIYTMNGQLGTDIEIIVATTKGDIDRVFDKYSLTDYHIQVDRVKSIYTASEAAFLSTTYMMYIIAPLDGGRAALSLSELRTRVVSRGFGDQTLPITRRQVTDMLSDMGYNTFLYREGVAGKTYVVSDDTPQPPELPYDTKMPIGLLSLSTSMQELSALPTVRSTPNSLTILPTTFYQHNGESLVPTTQSAASIASLTVADRVLVLNSSNNVFSPLYYVVEEDSQVLRVTPWSFNRPSVGNIDRIAVNTSLPDVFQRTAAGAVTGNTTFTIGINIAPINIPGVSSSSITCQLNVVASDGNRYYVNASINSTPDGYYIAFYLPTGWRIMGDKIQLFMNQSVYLPTTFTANVIYGLTFKPTGYMVSSIDNIALDTLVTRAHLLHETMEITLGTPLKHLWTDVRAYNNVIEYQRYTEDEVYTTTTSVIGSSSIDAIPFNLDANCNIVYKPVTTTTTVIRTPDGDPIYKHRKGDFVLDELGNRIPLSDVQRRFRFNVLCMEDQYLFVDEPAIVDCIRLVQQDLVQKSTKNMETLLPRMLERTNVFYAPTRTLGVASLEQDGKSIGYVDLQLRLTVILVVTAGVYNGAQVRKELSDITVKVINKYFTSDMLSYDGLVTALRTAYGQSVLAVNVNGLPDILDSSAGSLNNNTVNMCVGTKAVLTPEGRLTIADDIVVEFVRR